ncbi:MAG: YncE family protein [Bacteroidales bacterium]|nr:YncE family protein [Bacteroidales bacterium]
MPSCMDYGPRESEDFNAAARGLFVVCEGNFMYGNASLSYYDPDRDEVENEVFARSNAFLLGDVAHSMTIYDNVGWVVVNNSGVIFGIDTDTFEEVARITGFTSPRYIHFISPFKAYVTQLWDSRICIVNPLSSEITGYIETGMAAATASTEQMVRQGRYLYVNCWSYQNKVLKIDVETDEIVSSLEVGFQPQSMVLDADGALWVLTDEGTLCRIDTSTFTLDKRFYFSGESAPRSLCVSPDGTTLFWIDGDVWKMSCRATDLPAEPFIKRGETSLFYGLTISPYDDFIYISDAIDYTQRGIVMKYTPDGHFSSSFRVGINPGNFCWK